MNLLTPIIVHETNVPAPEYEFLQAKDDQPPEIVSRASKERKVKVNVCSEFMEYSAPVGVVKTGSDLRILQDGHGQPIVFALSADQSGSRLLCFIRVNGGPISWQRFDISPVDPGADVHINCFDISPGIESKAYIAASVMSSDDTCDVYHAMMKVPDLAWNEDENRVSGFQPKAGSQAQGDTAGTQYTIETNPRAADPWHVLPPPETAEKVLQLCAGATYDGPGVFTLFQRPGAKFTYGCDFEILDDGNLAYGLQTQDLGTIHSIAPNANPWGQTDLFIASEKGIAFFNFEHLDGEPLVILPGIEFKQIAASELVGAYEGPLPTQTNFTIFALSEHDELYFIEGVRIFATHEVRFETSGFPIRTNIDVVSAQYNSKINASELIYVGNGQDVIRHLWKDPWTSLWNETDITVAATGEIKKYQAYVSTITITDDLGSSLNGYPFSLSSDFANVLVNGRTYILDASPAPFVTGTNGKCTIVAHVDGQLGASKYELRLTEFVDTPFDLTIEPAQRTIRILGSINSANNIKDAVSTTGQPVFRNSHATDEDFEVAGIIMSNFPHILESVSSKTAEEVLDRDTFSKVTAFQDDASVAWERDASGKVKQTDLSWTDEGADVPPTSWLGDILESVREKFKVGATFVLKVAFKYVVPYLPPVIYIWVAGKLLKFLLLCVGPVVRWFANFLKDTLGIDLNGFLDWLGFLFDMEKTKETQKVLKDITLGAIDTCKRFFSTNEAVFLALIEEARHKTAPYIKDTRPPVDDAFNIAANQAVSTALDFLFNNPILNYLMRYNPVMILLEAASEELDEYIQIPSMKALDDIWARVLPKLAKDEFTNLVRLVDDILIKFKGVLNGDLTLSELCGELLGDAFWTLFDALKAILVAVIEIVIDVIAAGEELLTGKWKFPLITDLWTEFTGQDFTLLNVATLFIAQGINLWYLTHYNRLPFDKDTNGAALVAYTNKEMDLSFLLSSNLRAAHKDHRFAHTNGTDHFPKYPKQAGQVSKFLADPVDPYYEKYKKGSVGFGLAARTLNMATIIVDGVLDLAEWKGDIGAAPTFKGIKKPLNTMHTGGAKMVKFTDKHKDIIKAKGWKVMKHTADVVSVLLRTGQLIYLAVAAANDDKVKDEYFTTANANAAAYASFKIINTAILITAFGVRFKSDIGANIIAVVGSFCDTVVSDLIIEDAVILGGNMTGDTGKLFAASCVELGSIACGGFGIVCHVAAKKTKDPYVLAFMGICNVLDFSCVGTALGMSANVIDNYPDMTANS